MKRVHTVAGLLLIAAVTFLTGCGQKHKVTQSLEEPYRIVSTCEIGEMRDAFPVGFDPEDKPTPEHIEKFETFLIDQLVIHDLFETVRYDDEQADYMVTGAFLDFKRGSGFLRFLLPFVGNASITVRLELVDVRNERVIFAGNFVQRISSYAESGDKALERVAEDFAKKLEEQLDDFN